MSLHGRRQPHAPPRGAARDPKVHNLFQIADMDSRVVRWVNADLVTYILPSADCQQQFTSECDPKPRFDASF